MEFIIHRVNSIKNLAKVPKEYGCEIDIRTDGSKLILNHDPFDKGDYFINYLDEYKNGTLVLNIKESGIEDYVLQEVRKRNIKNYFLLDVEFPYLYQSTKKGERNIAVRYSEMEPIENVLLFKDKVDFIWIDTNTKLPLETSNIDIIKKFKTCLVCPSRWGRTQDIQKIKKQLLELNYKPNLVMTELNKIKLWNF
tara:strand:- start:36820 stop:37404 length:585 start_codon:yes stop_codon:yes gene_type:complete